MKIEKRHLAELAVLEFGDNFDRTEHFHHHQEVITKDGRIEFRKYLDPLIGHGHLQRIIDGLDFPKGITYWNTLVGICRRDDTDIWSATCEQKAEAILRQDGSWDTKEGGA